MKIKIDDGVYVVVERGDEDLTVDVLENLNAGVRAFARAYEGAKGRVEIDAVQPVAQMPAKVKRHGGIGNLGKKTYVKYFGKPLAYFLKDEAETNSLTRSELIERAMAKGLPPELKENVGHAVDVLCSQYHTLRDKIRMVEASRKLNEVSG